MATASKSHLFAPHKKEKQQTPRIRIPVPHTPPLPHAKALSREDFKVYE